MKRNYFTISYNIAYINKSNYFTKVSVSWVKEEIELLAKLVYHYRAGPWRLEPTLLHMHASRCSRGMATVNIRCL